MIAGPTTKELFAASFRDLCGSMPVNRVTVREIARNCGYSPATFYRLFRDKYEPMAWDYARSVNGIMAQVGRGGYRWRDTLLEGAQYFWTSREFVRSMLHSFQGREGYERLMMTQNSKSLRAQIRNCAGESAPDDKIEQYVRIYCMGTVRLCCEWLMGEFHAEPAEIAEIWENALPRPPYAYLYDGQ